MADVRSFRAGDLIAAPFTPLLDDGEINFPLIKEYADYLVKMRFNGLFVNGSLGEGVSMTVDERKRLAETWMEAAKGRLQVILHVGSNCVKSSEELSRHAEKIGADAIAAFTPSYYKPENEEVLADTMAKIAAAAPKTPFYYYDINFMTGYYLNLCKFMEMAKAKIPTLVGLKHSSKELPNAHNVSLMGKGSLQVLIGTDVQYLGALSLGLTGDVMVSYLGTHFYKMKKAFQAGDMKTAYDIQVIAQKISNVRDRNGGGIAVAKYVFTLLSGINVGPVRLPLRHKTAAEVEKIRKDLIADGLLDACKPDQE